MDAVQMSLPEQIAIVHYKSAPKKAVKGNGFIDLLKKLIGDNLNDEDFLMCEIFEDGELVAITDKLLNFKYT
tara:strand:- start:37002 stop:37217 length:216 start_codon:yes stop_codon:yes gene_type:complete